MKKRTEEQLDREQEKVLDERAYRLMEALSGVDEELLERCEHSGRVVQISAFRRNAVKYGRACAALVCLVAAGMLAWGGYRVGLDNVAGNMESAIEEVLFDESNETAMPIPDMEFYTQTAGGMEETMEKITGESADGAGNGGSVGNTGAGQDVEITLEEAYKIKGLGEYIPTVLPEGYVFESVHCYGGEEPGELAVCWSRGLDSIFWHICRENAEAVPEENREILSNPVCRFEDFDLGFVEKRMIGGGAFSVLYPDGVVVKFNGRGTAQEVWEMFESLIKD